MGIDVGKIAARYRKLILEEINSSKTKLEIKIVGFLIQGDKESQKYALLTKNACIEVGIPFELVSVTPENVEACIEAANQDDSITGIFIYYPIHGDDNDDRLRRLVSPQKDIEGMSDYWTDKLYANQRFDDLDHLYKAILTCTPLAILKLLEETDVYAEYGLPLQGQTITIFNRSTVVGRPLAYMLANDGAQVFSFDKDGGMIIISSHEISREDALRSSDVVITGVPSKDFELIKASELKEGVICINLSHFENFAEDAQKFARIYVPRIGSLTIAMFLRNAVRLASRDSTT